MKAHNIFGDNVAAIKSALMAALFAIVLAFAAPVAAQDFEAGFKAYRDGDYAAALLEWRPLAEQGQARAQAMLGIIYDNGLGVPEDDAGAVKWYRMAADQGDTNGQYKLGIMYGEGQGVAVDHAEAAKWYRMAADQGDERAQASLGLMYLNGDGVPQDYVLAHMWSNLAASQEDEGAISLRELVAGRMTPEQIAEAQKLAREWAPNSPSISLASPLAAEDFEAGMEAYQSGDYAAALGRLRPLAEHGHAEAQFNLGLMYVNGQGVAQDHTEAMKWYREAAEQELATAQYNLGLMYGLGQGVPQNFVMAHMWWTLAARQGHRGAAKNRDIAAGGMTPAQIAEAENLAREWKPK